MNLVKTLQILWWEARAKALSERIPEPAPQMDDIRNVSAFDREGAHGGVLEPIYLYNARAISRLSPMGGTVLDLGCGTGQFLKYLNRLRPDLHLIGIDFSPPMIHLGKKRLKDECLEGKIELRIGDMTKLEQLNLPRLDLILSLFSMHHLPSVSDVQACVRGIAQRIQAENCNFWCFDHHRPKSARSAKMFPRAFSPQAELFFQKDSANSLMASFTLPEMRSLMAPLTALGLQSQKSRVLGFYQQHWLQRQSAPSNIEQKLNDVSSAVRLQSRLLGLMMRTPVGSANCLISRYPPEANFETLKIPADK